MYANIILDIAHSSVDRLFTYRIPEGMELSVGSHVLVPFGHGNRPTEGFVLSVSDGFTGDYPVKDILRPMEPYPVLLPDQIALADWIRRSYHCVLADALRLMIPPQLRGSRVHEKVERTFRLADGLDLNACRTALTSASGRLRAPKQMEVLELLDRHGPALRASDLQAYLPNASAAIPALQKRGWIVEEGTVTFRSPGAGLSGVDRHVMPTEAQQAAIEAISAAVRGKGETFLLHGVTGSGKTEVYMHAITAALEANRQAIMLVPEISLTPQTVGRFRARFGEDIAVLHSRLSAGERYDEWRRIRLGKANVVVGARSAIFAPLPKLGLIVVDEEHEASYQSETNPRYHAVDVAQRRRSDTNATLVLGSATPQLLTYYRALSGRYHLLSLPERVLLRPMPQVDIVDMREEFLSGNNGIFSRKLASLLGKCFADGRQAMLFLNRRGYSTFVSCRACGAVVQCPNCDISMTYHKGEERLRCHFCGASAPLPAKCPECGKAFIKYFGIGTEQVEEQLHRLFPSVKSLRMDADTMRSKDSMQLLLSSFAKGEAQALIGTQMIAKGHDFPNVTLVGVIAADSTLCIPDYRSTERTFQLLTQVAGRAGRDETPGRVIVQTYSPGHPAVRYAKTHDYDGFYRYEIAERQKALFPPFSLFVRLLFTGKDEQTLTESGEAYGKQLEETLLAALGSEGSKDLLLLLPSPAPIRRRKGDYRYQILIKLLRTVRTPDTIRCIYAFTSAHASDLFASIEINPQDML